MFLLALVFSFSINVVSAATIAPEKAYTASEIVSKLVDSKLFTTTVLSQVKNLFNYVESNSVFTRDLTIGSWGADVTALQQFLVSKGFMASEFISGYFAAQTKTSLAKYQSTKGISPADGYFGAITRSVVIADNSGTSTAPETQINISWSNGKGNVQLALVDSNFSTTRNILGYISLKNDSKGSLVWNGKNVTDLSGSKKWDVSSLSKGPFNIIAISSSKYGNYCIGVSPECNSVSSDSFNLVKSIQNINLPAFSSQIITITSPNGGENLNIGSPVKISWVSDGKNTQKVLLNLMYETPNSGGGYSLVRDLPTTGSFVWTVPKSEDGSSYIKDYGKYYKVRACLTENNSSILCDDSDGVFTITSSTTTQPSITIISPNGGGYYKNDGSQIDVTWKTTNVPSNQKFDVIRLREYPNGKEYNLVSGVVNDGNEKISIPKTVPAGAYTLEIKTYVGNTLVMDSSDSYFKISDSVIKPSITVISPNGGETAVANKTMNVKWSSQNLGNLNINIDLVNRAEYIVANLANNISNTGSYTVSIPSDLEDGLYKIMVSTNDKGPSVVDNGDGYFSTINGVTKSKIVIKSVQYSPASPKVNDWITATVVVSNDGSQDYKTPFKVNVQGKTVTIPALAAGAKTTVTVSNAFSFSFPGTQTLNTIIIYPSTTDPSQGMTGDMFTNTLTFSSPTCTINQFAVCTADYSPVCGSDGKTYSNACGAVNKCITTYTKGACASSTSTQATPTYGQCYSATPTDWPACCNVNNDSSTKSVWKSSTGKWSKFPKSCGDYPGYKLTPIEKIDVPSFGQISFNTVETINQTLKQGQSGNQVATLQTALQQVGVYSGPITGFFGDLTKKAVASFQQANALEAIGEVGPKTRELLNSLFR